MAQGVGKLQIKRNVHGSEKKGLLECKIPNLKSGLFYYCGNVHCQAKDSMSCPDIGNINFEGEKRKKPTYTGFESLYEWQIHSLKVTRAQF